MTTEIVVIGADAAGASAASGIKRALGDDAHVLVLEKQRWTSYSACGIPYWVSGEVDGPTALVVRSPEKHRANGLDLRTGTEAIAIDPRGQTVTARDLSTGERTRYPYDHLVITTGAVPVRPDIPGVDLPGVHGVQTLDDGQSLVDSLGEDVRRAVVVGAGYIGIEMAEAMCARNLDVLVLDLAEHPMTTLDPDMGERIEESMNQRNITYRGGEGVTAIEAGEDGRADTVITAKGEYPADIVILGIGVRGNSGLAASAGLPVGDLGGILTDDHMRVLGYDNIWAGGDCVEVHHRLSGRNAYAPMGTHANKHGRVISTNVAGGDLVFPGIIGTSVSKVCDLEISRTGLREQEARDLGFDVVSATIKAATKAHYFPGAGVIHAKVIAEKGTGRLLGCQIVGKASSGKRIDAAAIALWNGMTAEELTSADMAYAPPFSPVWDPIQTAARRVAGMV